MAVLVITALLFGAILCPHDYGNSHYSRYMSPNVMIWSRLSCPSHSVYGTIYLDRLGLKSDRTTCRGAPTGLLTRISNAGRASS